MKRRWYFCLAVVIGVLLAGVLLAGCAPAPAPTPPPMAPAPVAATPAPPQASPEEVAWAAVVERAKKEGNVTAYGYVFPGEIGQAVRQAFKDRYGITVEILTVSGRTALEKIKVEQQIKKPVADVVVGGLSVGWDLARLGLVAVVVEELPALKNRDVFIADVVDMNGQLLYVGFSQSDVLVNTKLMKPQDEPKSYSDLLDPKFKGQKILFSDPRTGGSGGWSWFLTSTFYKTLDYDYFRRFMQQQPVMSQASTNELISQVARGEYHMNAGASADAASHMIVAGAPIKVLALQEGSWASGTSLTVIKNAAHPNAARLFANWFFSKEGQLAFYKAASDTPVRKDVPDFMPPGVRPEPKKLFVRTVEVMEAGFKLLQGGTLLEIFGPK